jgi:uncharacterized protein YggE
MATNKRGRAGGFSLARPNTEAPATQAHEAAGVDILAEKTVGEDTKVMLSDRLRTQTLAEGVTVTGEAVRRIASENAEFLIEITSTAPTTAQVLRDNQAKTVQVTQAISQLGVGPGDVQSISLKVQSLYSPMMQSLPGYPNMPQIAHAGLSAYAAGAAIQPEVQFGSYMAINVLRINTREPGRAGDVADLAVRAGATLVGGLRFRAADEAGARRAALEAAAKDARTKAEGIAAGSGKQIGDPVAITEELVACNGNFGAIRAMAPFAFGAGAPEFVGDLEYYARVSANFRFA